MPQCGILFFYFNQKLIISKKKYKKIKKISIWEKKREN